MKTTENFINLSCDKFIGFIELNDPPQNYIPFPDFIEVEKLNEFILSNQLKGLIIKGVGRHFSAGANQENLFEMATKPDLLLSRIEKGVKLLDYIESLEIPVVSSITGACFGGGLEIALASHFRICSEKSLFAFPESSINLMPGLGGISKFLRTSSDNVSLFYLLSGEIINAQKALELKLVDHISYEVKPEEFALQLMNKMVKGKPLKVINSIIRSVNNYYKLPYSQALKEETKMFCELAEDESKRRIV
jgi:enoyl-CoA hydratase/carnithine racemase